MNIYWLILSTQLIHLYWNRHRFQFFREIRITYSSLSFSLHCCFFSLTLSQSLFINKNLPSFFIESFFIESLSNIPLLDHSHRTAICSSPFFFSNNDSYDIVFLRHLWNPNQIDKNFAATNLTLASPALLSPFSRCYVVCHDNTSILLT